jgi:hypothetical protein
MIIDDATDLKISQVNFTDLSKNADDALILNNDFQALPALIESDHEDPIDAQLSANDQAKMKILSVLRAMPIEYNSIPGAPPFKRSYSYDWSHEISWPGCPCFRFQFQHCLQSPKRCANGFDYRITRTGLMFYHIYL